MTKSILDQLPDPDLYDGSIFSVYYSVAPTPDISFLFYKDGLEGPLYRRREQRFQKVLNKSTGKYTWVKVGEFYD